ncbi:MAG: ROK family protein [Thermomicrobiales bacterium]|nr:ROK family protein [Thermomicrobiales bacterium]
MAERGGFHIGVDLGGTNIKFVLLGRELNTTERLTVRTDGHEGHDAVLDRMIDGIQKLEAVAGGPGAVASVGVAVPGVLDMVEGHTIFLPNLPGHWADVPVGRRIHEVTGLHAWLINDVRAFTVGELELGSARGYETAICYAVGTGIGGGIVTHGKVNFGLGGAGGELGHMIVDPQGPRCGCGNRGCAESFATGPAIVGEANRRISQRATTILHDLIDNDLNRMTVDIVERAATMGDAVAIEVLDNAGYYLGLAVANAIAALAPEVVILGGGNCKPGGIFWNAIERTARAHCHVTEVDRIVFKPASLGYEAGVIGAAIWGKKVEMGEAVPKR